MDISIFVALCELIQFLPFVHAKGGAVIGGSAGGGQVCVECNPGGNYTQEEMRVALIILIIILCVFFALCSCQCYNRIKYECNENSSGYNQKGGSVPEAPYYRDCSQSTAAANMNALSNAASAQALNEAMLSALVKL